MGRIHRWGMLVAFLVIIGCAYLGVKMVFVEDKDVAVPGVTGMQLVDALNALQTRGLLAKVDKVDSSAPEDTVVAQNLSAGEKVSKGKVVLLRVSKGGAAQAIPDVRGLKFEEGVKMLGDAGFKVDRVVRVTDKLTPSGTVIFRPCTACLWPKFFCKFVISIAFMFSPPISTHRYFSAEGCPPDYR